MTNNANEPAFPIVMESENGYGVKIQFVHSGLTKREHFAGIALGAILESKLPRITLPGLDAPTVKTLATLAVTAADALLEELEKSRDNAE